MSVFPDHQIQFYEPEAFTAPEVGSYLHDGIAQKKGLLVMARSSHWEMIQRELTAKGHDLHSLVVKGQLLFIDINQAFEEMFINGKIAPDRFEEIMPARLCLLHNKNAGVRIYGEVVDLLIEKGHVQEMMILENLWNELREKTEFDLLCGYNLKNFSSYEMQDVFDFLCETHGYILPSTLTQNNNHSFDSRVKAMLSLRDRHLRQLLSDLAINTKWATLGEMSAGVAHELNNPLAVVTTAIACLEDKLPADPESHHLINLAKRSTDRIASIVQNIRLFTRISKPEMRPFSLTQSLQKVVDYQKPDLINLGINLNFDPNYQIQMKGESFALEQVFMNFINNARDAIRSSEHPGFGTIELKLSPTADGEIKIEISDNGAGMSEETMKRIFTPFFTTKGATQGTGLGLSMSYGIIRQHGGKVECHSQLGEGTRFVLTMPAEIAV